MTTKTRVRLVAVALVLAAGALGLGPGATSTARASICCSECYPVYLECLHNCAGQPTWCLGACRDWRNECNATCDSGC